MVKVAVANPTRNVRILGTTVILTCYGLFNDFAIVQLGEIAGLSNLRRMTN